MGEATKIEWTDHTFNPWRGCSKVHTGCKNCYAETQSKRNHGVLGIWGEQGTRVVASESMWREPLKWNAVADAEGVRRRVFCASLADVFEDFEGWVLDSSGAVVWWCDDCRVFARSGDSSHGACCAHCGSGHGRQATLADVRLRLFRLIDATPHLDWLLLTKRPENIRGMWPPYFPGGYIAEAGAMNQAGPRPNVWIGTSISDQETADKAVPELLACRDLAPVLFLSAEPLVGPIDLLIDGECSSWACRECGSRDVDPDLCVSPGDVGTYGCRSCGYVGGGDDAQWKSLIDWVIVGGESGPKARRCDPDWVRSLVQQCQAANVPVFVKQMGANVITRNDAIADEFNDGISGWPDPQVQHDIHGFREEYQGADCRIKLRDRKGGNPDEWPQYLRVRQFPEVQQ